MKHATVRLLCNDGKRRGFHTLCGLVVGREQAGVTINPGEVDCKRCRKSQAWVSFLEQEK